MYDRIKCEYYFRKLVIHSMPKYICKDDKNTLIILLQKILNYNPEFFLDRGEKADNLFFLNMKSAVILFRVSAVMKLYITLEGICLKSYNNNYMWSEVENLACEIIKYGDISDQKNNLDQVIIQKYANLFDELFLSLKPFSFILGNFDESFYSLNCIRFFSNCENSSDNLKNKTFQINSTEIMSHHTKGKEIDEDKIPIFIKMPHRMNLFRRRWTVCLSSPKKRFYNMLKITRTNVKKMPEIIDQILLSMDFDSEDHND